MGKRNTPARDHKAMLLRQDGKSFQVIADEMDYLNRDGAWKAVQRALKHTQIAATPDENKQVELARLDELTELLMPLAKGGDLGVVDRLLKISVQRSRLLGLYTSVNAPAAGSGSEADGPDAVVISMADAQQRLAKLMQGGA